jgi:hypothetical protein
MVGVKMKNNPLVYDIGDLVCDPISGIIGVITKVYETYTTVDYEIYWQKTQKYNKRLYNHYEISLIARSNG